VGLLETLISWLGVGSETDSKPNTATDDVVDALNETRREADAADDDRTDAKRSDG